MMPRAPRPTRPTARTSGSSAAEAVSTEPSAVTSSRPMIWVASPPSLMPVPWVPVDTAPEMVW